MMHPPENADDQVRDRFPRLRDFAGRRVLLLQGPPGPFFRRLARDLRQAGAEVRKINFHGGDWLFYPHADLTYTGSIEDWPETLRACILTWGIDTVMLYGDMRPVHAALFSLVESLPPLDIFTFEEGYLRPNHITLERGRANGHSHLLRKTSPQQLANLSLPRMTEHEVPYSFPHLAWHGFRYHAAATLLRPLMPGQTYHRGLGIVELPAQLRSYWRKLRHRKEAERLQQRLLGELSGKYFLVPLQVALDSQILHHSKFARGGIPAFIREVVASFAAHAPEHMHLAFKHHPMDRGYTAYFDLMDQLRREHPSMARRLHYTFDLHLPSAMNHAAGVVVVNSTVGLSAMRHGAPVKVHGGKAIYDLPGLTAQVALDEFWTTSARQRPDKELVEQFCRLLASTCQINGNFYRRLPQSSLCCGLLWEQPDGT